MLSAIQWMPYRCVPELPLDLDGELDCLRRTSEEGKNPVAGDVHDPTAVIADQGFYEADGPGDPLTGPLLVLAHQPTIAVYVGKKDRRQISILDH